MADIQKRRATDPAPNSIEQRLMELELRVARLEENHQHPQMGRRALLFHVTHGDYDQDVTLVELAGLLRYAFSTARNKFYGLAESTARVRRRITSDSPLFCSRICEPGAAGYVGTIIVSRKGEE